MVQSQSLAVLLLFSLCVRGFAAEQANLEPGLLKPCDASRSQFEGLARTVTNRTAAQCATELQRVKEACLKQPDKDGLEKIAPEPGDVEGGLRRAAEAQRQSFRLAREKFEKLRKVCGEGRRSVRDACQQSQDALETARNDNTTARQNFEKEFTARFQGFAGQLPAALSAATARFREVDTELGQDLNNLRNVRREADQALMSAESCNDGFVRIYADAEARTGETENLASADGPPKNLEPASASSEQNLVNSVRDTVAGTAVQTGAQTKQALASLGKAVTPLMAVKAAAVDKDPVSTTLGIGQTVVERTAPLRWGLVTGGVGAFLATVTAPSPTSSCQGAPSPVQAYRMNCGFGMQSIDSTISILGGK